MQDPARLPLSLIYVRARNRVNTIKKTGNCVTNGRVTEWTKGGKIEMLLVIDTLQSYKTFSSIRRRPNKRPSELELEVTVNHFLDSCNFYANVNFGKKRSVLERNRFLSMNSPLPAKFRTMLHRTLRVNLGSVSFLAKANTGPILPIRLERKVKNTQAMEFESPIR